MHWFCSYAREKNGRTTEIKKGSCALYQVTSKHSPAGTKSNPLPFEVQKSLSAEPIFVPIQKTVRHLAGA